MIKANVERGRLLAATREEEAAFLKDLADSRRIDEMIFDHQNPEPSDGREPYTTSPFTTNSAERKNYPVYSGCLNYFPDALMACCDYRSEKPTSPNEIAVCMLRQDWVGVAVHSLSWLEMCGMSIQKDPLMLVEESLLDFMLNYSNALAKVCKLSKQGNDKHNPGEPLHWSRDKSNDHKDCIARHLIDGDWVELAWRALANLQVELEDASNEQFAPDFEEVIARMRTKAVQPKHYVACVEDGLDDAHEIKHGWRYVVESSDEESYVLEGCSRMQYPKSWFQVTDELVDGGLL